MIGFCHYFVLIVVCFCPQDLYVFISESKTFSDFQNKEALIWRKNNLIYGDWNSGPNGDGTHLLKSQIQTPPVSILHPQAHSSYINFLPVINTFFRIF